ncbi:hypothetical protein K488DRAFT_41792 [Vararia minispora EC-137]|uniref:Uncharacterized protein n=1 Tax=Vararia minispora EC-137 TaxID=1314806 RepID=A0ACB8QWW4_9AGAM|nr:hypothetical protein K488DRAFT_41792 [Vararia minispora EC-137]
MVSSPLRGLSVLFSLRLLSTLVLTCLAAQPFAPAAVPLAARSPYLLSFLQTTDPGPEHSQTWPTGFSRAIVGWAGLVRVDGTVYAWLGDKDTMPGAVRSVAKLNQTLTSTRTIFSLQAGPVELTATFLSPIEPGDFVKQSIPFSYMAMEAQSLDGQTHSVQVYSDISGEWVSGDRSENITWSTELHGSSIYHAVTAAVQHPYEEFGAQANWGTVYYAAQQGPGVTLKAGDSDVRSRQQFVSNGTLDNAVNQTFRAIQLEKDFPVFAYAMDFGQIQSTEAPIVWAIGQVRDSATAGAVLYQDLSGATQTRSLYYVSNYTDDGTLIDDFLNDYPAALSRAEKLDSQLLSAASALGGSDYADLISITARQAYSGTELTIGRNADGGVNTSDVMMFMKDLGFPDNGAGNPVDGLFAIFPAFVAIDPALGGFLLEPLLRFQKSTNYQNPYAAQNLGLAYPNATGLDNSHTKGLEESANMIIMTYGFAKSSRNNAQAVQYYNLLKGWANYCASQALNTSGQTSSDGLSSDGQTNLALKGIIAVKAMAGISRILNNTADATSFTTQAQDLYQQWLQQALAADGHMLLSYGAGQSSWSIGYNMFADLWLETGLLDTSIVDAQVKFVQTQISPFGIAIDSSNLTIAASHWDMFTAAVAARNASAQHALIAAVHSRASQNKQYGQFPAVFSAVDGTEITGFSRQAFLSSGVP